MLLIKYYKKEKFLNGSVQMLPKISLLKKFQKYVKSKNITHFVTHNEKQANYVECFIKTIKNKIFKYMVE